MTCEAHCVNVSVSFCLVRRSLSRPGLGLSRALSTPIIYTAICCISAYPPFKIINYALCGLGQTSYKAPVIQSIWPRRGTSQRRASCPICMQGDGKRRHARQSKRVCTHARAAACTIRAAAVAKMGRGARCSSSVSVSHAARAGVTQPRGGGEGKAKGQSRGGAAA